MRAKAIRPWTSRLRGLALWLSFLLVALAAALANGTDTPIVLEPGLEAEASQTGAFLPGWSADEFLARFQGPPGNEYRGADAAAYLLAGRALLEGRGFEAAYVPFWPPGMGFVSAFVVGLFGGDHYPLKMILLSAFLWSVALTVVYWAAAPRRLARYAAWCFLAAFLWLPALRAYAFGFGSVMSETSSHAFFVAGLALLARGLLDEHRRFIVASGLCLAAAALLRAFFDYVAIALYAGFPLLLVSLWLIRAFRDRVPWSEVKRFLSPSTPRDERPRMVRYAVSLALALFLYEGALLPWRIYKHHKFGQHGLVDFDSKYMWSWSWMGEEEVPWYHHTGNTACRVDPLLCRIVRENRDRLRGFHLQKLAVGTFLAQPGRWLSFKAKGFNWFWLGRTWRGAFIERPMLGAEGVLLVLLGLGALGSLIFQFARTGDPRFGLVLTMAALVVAAHGLVFTFLQYEWRYSQPLRTLMYFLPLWAAVAVNPRAPP